MKPILFAVLVFATLSWVTAAHGQSVEAPDEAKSADEPTADAPPEVGIEREAVHGLLDRFRVRGLAAVVEEQHVEIGRASCRERV